MISRCKSRPDWQIDRLWVWLWFISQSTGFSFKRVKIYPGHDLLACRNTKWSTTHQIYIEFGTHALDVKMHISYADGHWACFFFLFDKTYLDIWHFFSYVSFLWEAPMFPMITKTSSWKRGNWQERNRWRWSGNPLAITRDENLFLLVHIWLCNPDN